MFLWGKNNATFHWINEGIHSINAEISISAQQFTEYVKSLETIFYITYLLSSPLQPMCKTRGVTKRG